MPSVVGSVHATRWCLNAIFYFDLENKKGLGMPTTLCHREPINLYQVSVSFPRLRFNKLLNAYSNFPLNY